LNKNQISATSGTFRKKRLAVGVVSVLTAGALLGVGVQGATAAPLTSSTRTSNSSATGDAISGFSGTFLVALKGELRSDLAEGHDIGEKAQNVATTLAGHAELFASLPANLQADLKTLKDAAPADLDTQANKIKDTALNGGYGAQIQKMVQSLQKKASGAPAT